MCEKQSKTREDEKVTRKHVHEFFEKYDIKYFYLRRDTYFNFRRLYAYDNPPEEVERLIGRGIDTGLKYIDDGDIVKITKKEAEDFTHECFNWKWPQYPNYTEVIIIRSKIQKMGCDHPMLTPEELEEEYR